MSPDSHLADKVVEIPTAVQKCDCPAWNEKFLQLLQELGRVGTQMCQVLEDNASLPPSYEGQQVVNTIEAIQHIRKTHNTVGDMVDATAITLDGIRDRTKHSQKKIKGLDLRTKEGVLTFNITQLPVEILLAVFFYATQGPEFVVSLSHVCQRFRWIILPSRSIWNRFVLKTTWDPRKILAVAERSGMHSLKASCTGSYIYGCYNVLSLDAILSLYNSLEELSFAHLKLPEVQTVRKRLNGHTLSSLRSLSIEKIDEQADPDLDLYENCNMPVLSKLSANFVPRPLICASLCQCSLDLLIFKLADLLNFLSSSPQLQRLGVYLEKLTFCEGFMGRDNFEPAKLPVLNELTLQARNWDSDAGYLVVGILQKIQLPAIQQFELISPILPNIYGVEEGYDIFLSGMQMYPTLQKVVMRLNCSFGDMPPAWREIDLADVFRRLPPDVKTLEVQKSSFKFSWDDSCDTDTFKARHLELLHFECCENFSTSLISSLRTFFLRLGMFSVEFSFEDCSDYDGTFSFDDVLSESESVGSP